MKYTIISIDDSRKEYKDIIRHTLEGHEEVYINCLDARPPEVDIEKELLRLGLSVAPRWVHMPPKRGDFGGFVGHFNAWRKCVELDEPLIVFEDDAIIGDGLKTFFGYEKSYDFVSLCVNDYGKQFYGQHVDFDELGYHQNHYDLSTDEQSVFYIDGKIAKVYQPWTLTAAIYTPVSARYLIDKVRSAGLYMNADAFVMHQARLQKFSAIAPVPDIADNIVKFNEGYSLIQGAVE